jgi:hypothetical protein
LGYPYPARFDRDGKLIRELPPEYTTDRLRDLIDAFWASDDPFIRGGLNDIPTFVRVIGKLLPQVHGARASPNGRPDPSAWERMREQLIAAHVPPEMIDRHIEEARRRAGAGAAGRDPTGVAEGTR